jgi:tRNA A-37 threonylcarbamoyl transferase component Bud32
MEFVRSKGYPVPEVFEVSDDGIDLVMARIEGPTMIEAASAQPWKLRGFGRELADLHESLHLLLAPAWLSAAACGSGERLLHMDLHPLNVMLSSKGAIVLDWTNAVRGDPLVDVAATWVLLASRNVSSSRVQGTIVKIGRSVLLKAFLKPFPKTQLVSVLGDVVEWKSRDPNMSASEVERMRSLL